MGLNKQELDEKLGRFYLQITNGDYRQARSELLKLRITETKLEDGIYHIKLRNPGLLIGVKAVNIESLHKFLNVHVHIQEETDDDPYYHILPYEYWET